MHVSINNSMSFGSIQVGIRRMNSNQARISDRLFDSIKYNEKYTNIMSSDLDIYMLPRKGKGIEVRFMDPYSGEFVKENDKVIKTNLYGIVSESVEAVTDKVVDLYEKIVTGKIKRPEADIDSVINGNTTMCRINPDKAEDFTESIREYKQLGYSQKEAEKMAFNEYRQLYHVENKDADF